MRIMEVLLVVNRPIFFIITHKHINVKISTQFANFTSASTNKSFRLRILRLFRVKIKGLVPDLSKSPACSIWLFFHDLQHHSGTQLKTVLEDQAICDCLIHAIHLIGARFANYQEIPLRICKHVIDKIVGDFNIRRKVRIGYVNASSKYQRAFEYGS